MNHTSSKYLLLLLLLLLLPCCSPLSIAATWSETGLTQSGQLQLISNKNTTGGRIASLTFNTAFSDPPRCIVALADLEVQAVGGTYYYVDTIIDDQYETGIDIYFDVSSVTRSLRVCYLAIDSVSLSELGTNHDIDIGGQFDLSPIYTGSGERSIDFSGDFSAYNFELDMQHTNRFLVWVTYFQASIDPQYFNLTVIPRILNSTYYSIIIGTSHTNKIHEFAYSRILFDQTLFESREVYFVDVGLVQAMNSRYEDLTVGMVWKSNEGFFAGMTSLVAVVDDALVPAIGFGFSWTAFEVTGMMRFVGMEVGYLNMRMVVCPSGYPYYNPVSNMCYVDCPVPDMFWLANNSLCIPCHYRCLTCGTEDPTICLSCNSSKQMQLSGDTCLCKPGYYDAGKLDCQPCNSTCQNCTSLTVCTSCLSNLSRYLVNGRCQCLPQYTEQNGSCLPCSSLLPGCLQCSSSDPPTCTNCDSSLQFSLTSTCQCPSNLFPSEVGCTTCSNLLPGCLTCTNSTVCAECSSENHFELVLSGGCSCEVGYYLSGVKCAKCPASCAQCSSETVCEVCGSGFTSNGVGGCVCDKEYLAIGAQCVACSSLILGCSECESMTVCTKCQNTPKLELLGTICSCQPGYDFDLTTQTCNLCQSGCGCPTGYYPQGRDCTPCSPTFPNCQSCPSSTSCSLCSPGYFLDSTCQPCPTGCLFCENSSSCITCNTHFTLSNQFCQCEAGYYFDGSICIKCEVEGCDVCTMVGGEVGCEVCYAGMLWVENISGSGGGGGSWGIAEDDDWGIVESLDDGVVKDGEFVAVEGVKVGVKVGGVGTVGVLGYCTCPEGFYINGTRCELCSKAILGCVTCLTNTTCIGCMSPFQISPSGNCTCPSHSFLSGSTCIICNATLPGCTSCSNSTNCTACNTTYGFTLTSSNTCQCSGGMVNLLGQCSPPCPAGQYYDGFQCSLCNPICQTCENQSFTCTSCTSPLELWLANCRCPFGTFMESGSTSCQSCSGDCLTCTLTSTTCLTCQSPMIIFGSTCICGPHYFMGEGCTICDSSCYTCVGYDTNCTGCYFNSVLIRSDCVPCDSHCSGCFGTTAAECYSCAWPYQNISGVCMCSPIGNYIDGSGVCRSCHASCRTCDGSTATDCLSCYSSQHRGLDVKTCICELPFMDARMLTCVNPCPNGFGSNGTNICDEICGDGKVYEKECDDGNTENGDGCSSTCQVENNYECINGTTTTPSVCSSTIPPSMKLIETVKDPMSNKVTFKIAFQPASKTLNTISNFSQVLSCNLPDTNFTYSYDQKGQLTIVAQYSTNLQNLNATFNFSPSVVGGAFFATNPTSITFPLESSNNLALEYYDQNTYEQSAVFGYACYAVLGLALAVFAVSLFAGRFIGVEMMGVVQAAYVGLMGLIWLPPLMSKLAHLQFANGLNTFFADQRHGLIVNGDLTSGLVPPWISSLHYESEMSYSMNYSVILLILPPIAALILFIASKIVKKKGVPQKLMRWSWAALCDFGLTATVFVLYHVIVSMAVFAKYTTTKSNLFAFSVADSILVVILSLPCLVMFKTHPQHFGAYKGAFKPDNLSQCHYWILVSMRILLAILLVAANAIQFVCFICMGVPAISLIYLIIRRPYLHLYNNIRAILNELFLASILAIYGYFRISPPQSTHNQILPIIVIVLLILTIILNLLAMLKYKHDQKSQGQTRQQLALMKAIQQMVNNEQTQFIQKTNGRWNAGKVNLREMVKGKTFKEESMDNELLDRSRMETSRLMAHRGQVRNARRVVKVVDDAI